MNFAFVSLATWGFVFLGSMMPFMAKANGHESCVLVFLEDSHQVSKKISQILKKSNSEKTLVIKQATPKDIDTCLESGATSVTLIGHSFEMSKTNVQMVYFQELGNSDKEVFARDLETKIADQLESLSSFEEIHCNETVMGTPTRRMEACQKAHRALSKYFKLLKRLKDPNGRVYRRQLLLNRALEKITQNSNVKELRIATCQSEKVIKSYSALGETHFVERELDLAPKSQVMSLLFRKDLVAFNEKWFKESLK